MQPINVEFEFERETKNTVRYQEITDEDRGVIGTLYVLRDAFDGDFPRKLVVTIKEPAKASTAKK